MAGSDLFHYSGDNGDYGDNGDFLGMPSVDHYIHCFWLVFLREFSKCTRTDKNVILKNAKIDFQFHSKSQPKFLIEIK